MKFEIDGVKEKTQKMKLKKLKESMRHSSHPQGGKSQQNTMCGESTLPLRFTKDLRMWCHAPVCVTPFLPELGMMKCTFRHLQLLLEDVSSLKIHCLP